MPEAPAIAAPVPAPTAVPSPDTPPGAPPDAHPETPRPVDASAVSPTQLAALAEGRRRAKKVMRAAGVACFSGWTLAVFGGISALFGLFSLPGFLLGLGLCAVAYVELRGARRLRALDVRAPGHLAANQLALAALVVVYCAWGMWQAVAGPGSYDAEIAAGGQVAEALEPIDTLTRTVTFAFYGVVILGSLLAQGCTALYYLTRRAHVVRYIGTTPRWVVEALRATA